jgi:hypothetical protein
MVCSASAGTGRAWLFISKLMLLTAYASWVMPHVMDAAVLSCQPSESSAQRSGPALTWPEILSDNLFTHFPQLFASHSLRSPAPFFVVGSCAFALALAVQGLLSLLPHLPHYTYPDNSPLSYQASLSSKDRRQL